MKKLGLAAVALMFTLSFAAGCKKQEAPQQPAPAEQKAPIETTAKPEGTQQASPAPAPAAPAK